MAHIGASTSTSAGLSKPVVTVSLVAAVPPSNSTISLSSGQIALTLGLSSTVALLDGGTIDVRLDSGDRLLSLGRARPADSCRFGRQSDHGHRLAGPPISSTCPSGTSSACMFSVTRLLRLGTPPTSSPSWGYRCNIRWGPEYRARRTDLGLTKSRDAPRGASSARRPYLLMGPTSFHLAGLEAPPPDTPYPNAHLLRSYTFYVYKLPRKLVGAIFGS
jgi:hypothetical protein